MRYYPVTCIFLLLLLLDQSVRSIFTPVRMIVEPVAPQNPAILPRNRNGLREFHNMRKMSSVISGNEKNKMTPPSRTSSDEIYHGQSKGIDREKMITKPILHDLLSTCTSCTTTNMIPFFSVMYLIGYLTGIKVSLPHMIVDYVIFSSGEFYSHDELYQAMEKQPLEQIIGYLDSLDSVDIVRLFNIMKMHGGCNEQISWRKWRSVPRYINQAKYHADPSQRKLGFINLLDTADFFQHHQSIYDLWARSELKQQLSPFNIKQVHIKYLDHETLDILLNELLHSRPVILKLNYRLQSELPSKAKHDNHVVLCIGYRIVDKEDPGIDEKNTVFHVVDPLATVDRPIMITCSWLLSNLKEMFLLSSNKSK